MALPASQADALARAHEEARAAHRTIVMPVGTPLDLMLHQLALGAADDYDYDLQVAAPIAAVRAIIAHMFPNSAGAPVDLTTDQLLTLAQAFDMHPDSVRKIALSLYANWRRGDKYTTVTSMVALAPGVPLTDNANGVVRVFVDHRERTSYDASVHPLQIAACGEFIHADMTNYVYEPNKQPSYTKHHAIVVYSVTAKYSAASLAKFEAATTRLRCDIDVAWWRDSVAVALKGRMDARMSLTLCMVIGSAMLSRRDVVVYFQREKKVRAITFAPDVKAVRINMKSMSTERDKMGKLGVHPSAERGLSSLCKTCSIRPSTIRCRFCGELRYCSGVCESVGWEKTHIAECKVYAKKMAGVPQPPGGAAVLKAKVKEAEN